MRHQMLKPYDVRFVCLGYLVNCMCDSSLFAACVGCGSGCGSSQGTAPVSVEFCERLPEKCEFR